MRTRHLYWILTGPSFAVRVFMFIFFLYSQERDMSLNCRLSNHNNTKRQSSTSSHSYDDLSDQFDSPGPGNSSNRLACSRNGYAKILPRSNSSKAAMSGGGANDMWAVKASGPAANSGDLLNSGSLVLPRYFFQPGAAAAPALGYSCNTVGGGRHSFGGPIFGGGENISERHHGTARSAAAGSSNSAPSGKKRNSNKYHKIGPRTLNPPPARMGIPPYALVPVRICDRGGRGDEEEGEGENETISAPWERGASGGFAINKPVPSHHQLNGGHGLASPAQVLSLQTSAIGLHAASGPKASATAIDSGGGSGGNDIFMSLRRLTNSGNTAARYSGTSSCSGGSSSTTTTATAAELSRLHQAAPLGGGRTVVADCGDVLEDDAFSNDDYVDMTSDAGDDDEGEESVDENYKALTDRALDHLVV
jgi:hypothetical protein